VRASRNKSVNIRRGTCDREPRRNSWTSSLIVRTVDLGQGNCRPGEFYGRTQLMTFWNMKFHFTFLLASETKKARDRRTTN